MAFVIVNERVDVKSHTSEIAIQDVDAGKFIGVNCRLPDGHFENLDSLSKAARDATKKILLEAANAL